MVSAGRDLGGHRLIKQNTYRYVTVSITSRVICAVTKLAQVIAPPAKGCSAGSNGTAVISPGGDRHHFGEARNSSRCRTAVPCCIAELAKVVIAPTLNGSVSYERAREIAAGSDCNHVCNTWDHGWRQRAA